MADYGVNADIQILAFGASNSAEDTRTTTCNHTATKIVNGILNIFVDITTPGQTIIEATNMIAVALLTTAPENTSKSVWWLQGMELLEKAKGDKTTDTEWGYNYPVIRD